MRIRGLGIAVVGFRHAESRQKKRRSGDLDRLHFRTEPARDGRPM
jgi:hypothetical protein